MQPHGGISAFARLDGYLMSIWRTAIESAHGSAERGQCTQKSWKIGMANTHRRVLAWRLVATLSTYAATQVIDQR